MELQIAVSYWLEATDGVPFDSYTDLVENRGDQSRRADALVWFDEQGVETDETHAFDDASAHASAPLVVFTLLASDDLGNGSEHARIEEVGLGGPTEHLARYPSFARPRVRERCPRLDGTPTNRMSELVPGEQRIGRLEEQDFSLERYVINETLMAEIRAFQHVETEFNSERPRRASSPSQRPKEGLSGR